MRSSVPEHSVQIEHADLSLSAIAKRTRIVSPSLATTRVSCSAVVDGMGGHADGARAAEVAMRTMVGAFWEASRPLFDPEGFLHLTMGQAHEAVVALGTGLPPEIRPRATCAVCLVQGSSAYWAHVGDSRVYLIARRRGDRPHARPQPRRAAAARRPNHRDAGAARTRCATTSNAASAATRCCRR